MVIVKTLEEYNSLLDDVTSISCYYVQFISLPKNKTRNLKSLIFSRCMINNLNNLIMYRRLRKLDLSHNNIENIPKDIIYLQHIKFLNLSFNSISEIPDYLYNLTKLEYLDMSDNNLTKIDKNITNLTSLDFLDVSNNRLIDIKINKDMNIKSLNVSGNFLYDYSFLKFTNYLVNLSMNNLYMIIIPEEIRYMEYIRNLKLQNNNIIIIPEWLILIKNVKF